MMMKQTLNDWLRILSNIGVIAGLLLVGYEVNQSRVLTRAELVSEFYDRIFTIFEARHDADFAAAMAKAIQTPDALTTEEIIQLSAHMDLFIAQHFSDKWLYDVGVFEETETFVTDFVPIFFGNEFGRAWWEVHSDIFPPDTVAAVNSQLAKIDSQLDRNIVERLQDRLRHE